MASVDVLIPTYNRPAALAVTLTSLLAQTYRDFRLVISDQTEPEPAFESGEVKTVVRLHELQQREVVCLRRLPRLGLADQRSYLLGQSEAPYVLFLDDDLVLEPRVLERLLSTIRGHGCGFVGAAPIGLSYRDDVRPHEHAIEFWERRVEPEVVLPASSAWQRHKLHNAANPLHVAQRLSLNEDDRLVYKVAWIGGCVLYDRQRLLDVGGFDFGAPLPVEHSGEDVLAELRVMATSGGCGLLPSGVYHLELPTTVSNREFDAPKALAHLIPTGPPSG
jgi:GT2 family glycosyltransferase